MTDKKPNNNDIIKALDICSKSTNGCSHSKYTCEDCYLNGQPMCSSVLLQDAIDLHTRQQAEIERLQNVIFKKEDTMQMIAKEKQEYFDKLQTVKKWWVMIMRKILFRGKRTDDGEWVEGNLFYDVDLEQAQIFYFEYLYSEGGLERAECAKIVDPSTVGQYTGLTDKNGKKIFEGDILESPIGRKAVVFFGTYKPWSTKDSDDFECWKLTLIVNNEGETKLECGLGKHCAEYMKVIGNIHDNPELLERSNNND